ncbi:unnamed protein product [Trichogramma brassicae]|uniref:Uncharacterized protein n=1 Tax=Trichogramma brassicae TaxID=86971 RepID=A0A6H5HXE4_9HYME|nr:unnamed protein product [Trichogramma brassicae]
MKFFAKHGLFEKSGHLEPNWYEDEEFASKVKEVTVEADLSLYDLMRLRPREVEKLSMYTNVNKFFMLGSVKGIKPWRRLTVESREACVMHLCEKMSRRFFRDWALESFLELIHYWLPILCCEMIIDDLTNQDLCNICLAALGQIAQSRTTRWFARVHALGLTPMSQKTLIHVAKFDLTHDMLLLKNL